MQGKRRYKGWKCVLLREKEVILSKSWLFLNGKENKRQINMEGKKRIFRKEF